MATRGGTVVAVNGYETLKWASRCKRNGSLHNHTMDCDRKRSRDVAGDQEVNGKRNAASWMLQIVNSTEVRTDHAQFPSQKKTQHKDNCATHAPQPYARGIVARLAQEGRETRL